MTSDDLRKSGSLPYPYSVKRHGVTITNCDEEPVQTPGCIQPHGMLLALRASDLVITQVSQSCIQWVGAEPHALLGQSVSFVLGEDIAQRLRETLDREPLESNPFYVGTASLLSMSLADVTVHTRDGIVLVEVEPSERQRGDVDYYQLVKRAVARLAAAPTLDAFCQAGAEEVRRATGLDRVMIYKFHPDHSGEVVAEARRPDLHSWLRLRYPAEDIPRPAREIFKRIGVRPLPDAGAEPSEMVPLVNPDTGRPLDMTYCALRGASVMYTEYLRNMEVAASLTMPILREGELWGLIACHHYTPTSLPFEVRAAGEFLGQVMSLQLKNAEERSDLEYRARLDVVHHDLLSRAARESRLSALVEPAPGLLDGIEAGGVALLHRGRWWTAGTVPSEPQLEELAGWLITLPELGHPARPVFASESLGSLFPPAAAHATAASGALAISLAIGRRSLLLWFRPEQVQTFTWGGNPHGKPRVLGPHGPRLTPRKSFDLWQEQVRGRAVPWKPVEIEAALKLRLSIMDLVVSRAEGLAALNAELARSNEELDAFAYIASHDLKEPLRGIHKYAHYLREEAEAGAALSQLAKERLDGLIRLTLRMDSLLDALLHFSRMGRLDPGYERVPLKTVLDEAIDMLGRRLDENAVEVRVPRPLPVVECDPIRTREILANLIANAAKYNDKPDRWVEIGFFDPDEETPPFFDPRAAPADAHGVTVLYVRDNGIGIDIRHYEQVFKMFKRLHARDAFGGGTGAGLAITRKLVEQHGGRLWIESRPGEGSTFFFTLAKGDSAEAGITEGSVR